MDLVRSNTFYSSAYLFVPDKSINKSKDVLKMETQLELSKKLNSSLR